MRSPLRLSRRPRTLRVPAEQLAELLRAGLRAAELEAEGHALRAEGRRLRGQIRASELAAQIGRDGLSVDLLENLPLTAAGELHEPALIAMFGVGRSSRHLHVVNEAG